MRPLLPTILFAFTAFTAQSQVFQWVETPPITFSMNHDLIGYPVVCDASGHVFTAGFKDNGFPFGSVILGDVFFNKYDGGGALAFTKTITGNVCIFDMVPDTDGNILIAAGFHTHISTGALDITNTNQGIEPILLKFDASGNLLWHYIPEIDGGFVEDFKTVAVDAGNNIYIGYDNYMDSYIMKLTPNGVPVLTILETQVNTVTSVGIDDEGNIYAAGSCANSNAVYAGVAMPIPENFQYNTYVAKYSDQGVFQWVNYVEDITCSSPVVMARTPDEVYFSSFLSGPFAFGDMTAEGPVDSGGFGDFFLARLNSDGEYQWLREVPGNGFANPGNRNYIDIDGNGDIYIGGLTSGTINWDNDVTTTTDGFGNRDMLILKYDAGGNILTAKTTGATGYDRIDGIAVGANSDLFLTGMAYGSVSFDNIEITGGNSFYPFVAKLNSVILGEPGPQLMPARLYPNPSSGSIFISNLPQAAHAGIFNALGQKVGQMKVAPDTAIDISALSDGIYFLKIGDFQPLKFVKN